MYNSSTDYKRIGKITHSGMLYDTRELPPAWVLILILIPCSWFFIIPAFVVNIFVGILITLAMGIGIFFIIDRTEKKRNGIKNKNYCIVKDVCVNITLESTTEPVGDFTFLHFAKHGKFEARYRHHFSVGTGKECYVVLINGIKKVYDVYSCFEYCVSEEDFYEKDGIYYPKK